MHRSRLAFALALVALVAAVVGALGPASDVRTTHAWPPSALPEGTPTRFWYTPLLLIRHRPDAISATVPCSLPPALSGAARPTTVLATARFPGRSDGLAVTRDGGQLVVSVGKGSIARAPLHAGAPGDSNCAYRLRLDPERWALGGGPGAIERRGDLETMPIVTGLFSALDLESGMPPSIEVTTAIHASKPTARQKVGWTVAAIAIVAALLLVAFERRPRRPWPVVASTLRSAAAHAHPADAVVGVALLGWWVLSPSYWDDGWIAARHASFSDSGGFSTYYDVLGANNPLGYWLDWVQQWFVQVSDALLVLRVPALLCLAATWVLCRWIASRGLYSSLGGNGVALWALGSTFLLGAFAWGMTVRPEPALALLVTGMMACAVRFLERETAASLALVAVLVPLAVSAHPAGLVSIAPVIVVVPCLVMWARPRLLIVATVATSAVALLAVLMFVGSDLEQRRDDARTFETYGTSNVTWRDETLRYARLSEFPTATPIRRVWVALAVLAALAYLLRRRANGRRSPDVSGPALALGLALLIATPSKWPWHFGALLGIAALAVASETAHLREEASRPRGWKTRPFLVIVAAMLTAAWSWSPRAPWALLDLRTLDWILEAETHLSFSKLAFLLPPILLGAVAIVELVRHGRSRLVHVPWRVATWAGPVLAVPAMAFTVAVLIADNLKADSWTLARQNLDTLTGNSGCGVADDMLAVVPESVRSLSIVGRPPRVLAAGKTPPLEGVLFFALGRGARVTPWFGAPAGAPVGLFVAGVPGRSGSFELEWGRRRDSRIEILSTGQVPTHFASDRDSYGFVAASELPARAPGANALRVTLRSGGRGGASVSAPVTYENDQLALRLERDSSRSLVLPELRTYFPCVQQPRLREGVVEAPQFVVSPFDSTTGLRGWAASPFRGLSDLYPLERLSVWDSESPPSDVAVFHVEQRIPGAMTAPPTVER